MPKAAAKRNAIGGGKKSASGAKKSKLYNIPEKIKEGTILVDRMKTEWKIGTSIGTGGFGEIYSASKKGDNKYDYVVKCEPHENGPLFVELHFYLRNARLDDISKFQKEHAIKSLGMPYMLSYGSVDINGLKHRFIIIPRYGPDVSKQFLANGRIFPEGACYRLALQMLDVYEYIHGCGYVHADLKASNILLGCGKLHHQAYLVDFGMASHYTTKDFKPDPKKMHNGTIEYTSRDAHLGIATMRADLEILGYNLIEWLGSELPWVKDKILTTPLKVQKAKENFMSNVVGNLRKVFLRDVPAALVEYFKYVEKMEYNEKPDYQKCRKIFTSALKTLKVSLDGDLDLKLKAGTSLNISPSTNKTTKMGDRRNVEHDISASEDETINASDDDDEDVIFVNRKETVKKKVKKLLKNPVKLTPKQRILANTSLKTRNKNDSSNSESSPSTSRRTKHNTPKSPTRTKISQTKQNTTPLKTSSTSKIRHTPISAKANVRMSPAVTTSSLSTGKTIINDRITPNKKPNKTYEFNFELDVSMDANVILNVKRKKKPLQLSQEPQVVLSRDTSSGQQSSKTSNASPVTKVKVRKVGGAEEDFSPRTTAVTVKKSRRMQPRPT